MPTSRTNMRAQLEQKVRRGLKRAFPEKPRPGRTVATAKQRPSTRRFASTKEKAQAGGTVLPRTTKEKARAGGVVTPRIRSPEVAAKAAAMRAQSEAGSKARRAKMRTSRVPLGRSRGARKARVRRGYVPGHPAARRM